MGRNPPVGLIILLLPAVLAGSLLPSAAAQTPGTRFDYTLVYLVHGDNDYLYHSASGEGHRADEKAVQEARSIGLKARHGEVLIFHIRPERRILWIFPKKDRRFLHYRNGKLVRDDRYSPVPDTALNPFGAEAALYNRYKSEKNDEGAPFRAFLYFGHEIPAENRNGYHASRANIPFNREYFVEGMTRFINRDRFDLTVLSTCENGTPAMAYRLKPYTRTLLASPQNLHLSHVDTQQLLMLEKRPGLPADSLALAMAEATNNRLEQSIQTVISLSVYQLDKMDYLEELSNRYAEYHSRRDSSATAGENIDCAALPFFRRHRSRYIEGVTVYYRPPRFGKMAGRETHSGWGCRRD